MKKRLLALALCLVMMTSLLPVAAYGENPNIGVHITGTGFEMRAGSGYVLKDSQLELYLHGDDNDYWGFSGDSQGLYQDAAASIPVTNGLVDGETYYFKYQLGYLGPEPLAELYANLDASNCSLEITGFTASFVGCFDYYEENNGYTHMNIIFQVTKNPHQHNWEFTVSESNDTLTAQCQNTDCQKEVSVSLAADSVTLPTSPFNAQLAGKEQFETATGAAISKIRYDYKGSDGVWHKDVDPVAANAKAGTYQAFVQVSNLPGPVESDGVVAMAENPDGTYTADLYVKYTAVDPAVTAQTGDNRPIELMLAGMVVFSALAAAAFILDNKRKYSR